MKVESLPFYIYGILLFFIQFGNIHLRANASDLTDVQQSFEAFVKQFGRLYLSEKERELRFLIFRENYEKITKVNAKKLSYTLGVGPFADFTSEEFRSQMLGFKPNKSRSPIKRYSTKSKSSPDEVDWTSAGYVSEVKNQQACGSCWSFSTTGTVESAWAIARNVTSPVPSLSEQQLLDCAGSEYGNYGCSGGDMRGAFEYLQKRQLSSEGVYPYLSVDPMHDGYSCTMVSKSTNDSYAAPQYALGEILEVDADDKALETAVAEQPVSIGVCADEDLWQHYAGGVMSGQCCTDLNHGVLAVGYGVDSLPFFKVKNSWGTGWGEDGYVRLERIDDGLGLCGMLQYSTAIEVHTPQCSSTDFCNAQGDSRAPTEDPMNWDCACTCDSNYAGAQCEWECTQDSDCVSSGAPYCNLDGVCGPTAVLPDGCDYLNEYGDATDNATDSVSCGGPLFCESGGDNGYDTIQQLIGQSTLTNFTIACSAYSGVDAEWMDAVSLAIVDLPNLQELNVDLGFTTTHDSIASFTSTILDNQPYLVNLVLILTATGLNDDDATAIGQALLKGKSIMSLAVNTRLNEEDDDGNLTGVGAGALTSSISQLPNLKNLVLAFTQDTDLGTNGANIVAQSLASGFENLESLVLDLQMTFFDSDEEGNKVMKNFGKTASYLGSTSLKQAVFDFDADIFNDNGAKAFGEGLACAIEQGVTLPNFNDVCHCNLKHDASTGCISLESDDTNLCLKCVE